MVDQHECNGQNHAGRKGGENGNLIAAKPKCHHESQNRGEDKSDRSRENKKTQGGCNESGRLREDADIGGLRRVSLAVSERCSFYLHRCDAMRRAATSPSRRER